MADKLTQMARKGQRGWTRSFTPRTDRRIKREVDRVPPTLDAKVQSKLRRLQDAGQNISLRSLTLKLWQRWADDDLEVEPDAVPPTRGRR